MADTKKHVDYHQSSLSPKEKPPHISETLRVLATDDSNGCLEVLVCQLQKCGYRVTATKSASMAIEMLRKNKDDHDIVITNAERSDIDGFKFLEIISRESDIPVIMVSANGDPKTVEKSVMYGARDFLLKPVPMQILRNIWQHVLRKTVYCPKSDAMEANPCKSSVPNRRHSRDEDESGQSSEESLAQKKSRVNWKPWLHEKFVVAVQQLGVDNAVPKKILELMNEPHLTRESIASHLQKYRNVLRKQKENMSQETESHMDTNGIAHFCNPIIHAPVGNHGPNYSNSYSEYGMSRFAGRNGPFLPVNYHDNVHQQNCVPSEAVNGMWKNMGVPVLRNVASGAMLTEGTFTTSLVGNASHNLPILSGPYSYSPAAGFDPAVTHQMYGDASSQTNPFSEPHSALGQASNPLPAMILAQRNPREQDRRSLVSFHSSGGSDFRGVSPASPVNIPVNMQGQVDGSSGIDQVGHTQSDRGNNGHDHRLQDSLDDDLSAIVRQFACYTSPKI